MHAGGLPLMVDAYRARELLRRRRSEIAGDPMGAFVRHAASTVPAYRAVDPSCGDESCFAIVHREQLSRRTHWSSIFDKCDLVTRKTSGTSGQALVVPRDSASNYDFVYGTYKLIFDRVPELSLPGPGRCAVVQINDNPQRRAVRYLNPELELASVYVVVLQGNDMADGTAAQEVAASLPHLLSGRPRGLMRLIEHCSRTGVQVRPQAVLTTGDNLHPETRACLEESYAAPVYDGYSSQEAGLVAVECPHRTGLVTFSHTRIDLIRASQKKSGDATPGTLLVTSAGNWALPVIRYNTKDTARLAPAGCSCGPQQITTLFGRESPWFTFGGHRVNPSVLNPIFESLPVAQFRVTQYEDEVFEIECVPDNNCTKAGEREIMQTVTATMKRLQARLARVRIVDRIGAPQDKVQRYVRYI